MAASVALVFAVIAGTAQPASAHAVLLRTDPSPQTTVLTPPSAIRLQFSEPVEVAFGAVRLFDVDGHRIDSGRIHRARGDREVVLPVSGLKDGTYTVTWRVASSDGHRVSGGFDFYVGAPSTISAVAVQRDEGSGPFVGWGFGVVRFVWFAGLFAIIGLVVGRRWVWTPAVRAADLAESRAADTYRSLLRRALPQAWIVLAFSGALSLVFQAATLSGLSLWSAAQPEILGEMLRTTFGRAWIAQVALTLLALAPVIALARGRRLLGWSLPAWIALLAVAITGLCVTAALDGHARTGPRPVLAMASITVHLLAVGVWVGGLGALVIAGGVAWRKLAPDDRSGLVRQLVPRFSRMAVVALVAVIFTGVVNSLANLASLSDLWELTYGRVLLMKIIVLLIALVFAARHRWGKQSVVSFQRTAAAELGLLLVAIALGAALIALVPGRSVALAARGPVNQERTIGAYTAQLFIDPTAVGANEVHVTFLNGQGLGASEVTNTTVTVARAGAALEPVPMRLISPGHFVGDATFPAPGEYELAVATGAGASTTFEFRLHERKTS